MANERNQDIPKYIVMEKSLIGNEIHEAGAVVEYDGLPADNLKPTDALGEQRRQEYIDSNAARVKNMTSQFSESAVGDPTKFAAEFAKQLKEDNEERDAKMATMIASAVAQAMAAAFPNGTAKPAAKVAAPVEAPPADTGTGTAAPAEGLA